MSKYEAALAKAKAVLSEAVLEQEPNLDSRIHEFDTHLAELLRKVGQGVMEDVANTLAEGQEKHQRAEGLTIQQRQRTPFLPCSDP